MVVRGGVRARGVAVGVRQTLTLLCASISVNKYPSCIMQRMKVKVKHGEKT